MQSHPYYSEGFHDAWAGEPLFADADPVYAAGWRAYWSVRQIILAGIYTRQDLR